MIASLISAKRYTEFATLGLVIILVFAKSAIADVRTAQDYLKKLGYDAGVTDGLWGGDTENALEKFLNDLNKAWDGNFDQEEMKLLTKELQKKGLYASEPQKSLQEYDVRPKSDVGGKAVTYSHGSEIPENARPNDATISRYEDRRQEFILRRKSQRLTYNIPPLGNAIPFPENLRTTSAALERELSEGYLLSYLYYEDGIIKYNGKASNGRFARDINNQTLFFTHSSGKSIVSYIVGHAICDGYITSIDEIIDWPMMSRTLYQGQSLRDLLNMSAGDQHIVDKSTTRIQKSGKHHRNMGLDTIANYLDGTKKRGSKVFYNNFLTDVIANYIVFKAGDQYDALMRKVFQDKVKIEHEVMYEKHGNSHTYGTRSKYFLTLQTKASYSFFITRMDFLRLAVSMMKDYQNQTCVGKYLKEAQERSKLQYKFSPHKDNSYLWIHRYAKRYGAQFYFDFYGMTKRNILATDGKNGQNIMIDLDNSRIVVTNSSATGWDRRHLLLNVIKQGELPK